MHKVIHSESIKSALAARGWTQAQLAKQLGESPQLVSLWLKGETFPSPAKLLKLATTLKLGFDKLVEPSANQPMIAFRKKAGAKTTDEHIVKARGMGELLKPLVAYLPQQQALHTLLPSPSTGYIPLQVAAAQVRAKIGIGASATLEYSHLIGEFKQNDAILVPVLWGEKQNHKNALHILLRSENVTFVYLNLDTRLEDFKFWMAHELAHVYTPGLAGTEEGEDFADAFAGALLFPQACAEQAYAQAMRARGEKGQMAVLQRHAADHSISVYTVFRETQGFAQSKGLAPLSVDEKALHALRNSQRGELVSASLFKPGPPKPQELIALTAKLFQSDFFLALQRLLNDRGGSESYVQQVLDVPLRDGLALFEVLSGAQVS
ncbi:helix-turn-helix domain-containing protein [Variovorax sp. RCC_210]|uniref:helix-turn-helix domain-containing protein n=1 Tax=Variovorax sp. RCC_210 TaxID=3239217 RepID=UPI0035257D04